MTAAPAQPPVDRPSPGEPGDLAARLLAIENALHARLRQGTGPVLAGTSAEVVIDAGPGAAWTVRLGRDGTLDTRPGAQSRADAHVHSDPETWVAILDGRESGVAAFLDGRLTARGNLALALQLDGIFAAGDRSWRFPRAGVVTAAGIRTPYLEAGARTPRWWSRCTGWAPPTPRCCRPSGSWPPTTG